MFEEEFHISNLIAGHFSGQLDAKQEEELERWKASSEEHNAYFNELARDEAVQSKLINYRSVARSEAEVWASTTQRLGIQADLPDFSFVTHRKVKKLWPKIAAIAASIFLVIGIGFFVYTSKFVNIKEDRQKFVLNDLPPGENRAYITLANGKKIELSNKKSGVVIDQKRLTYTDGGVITAATDLLTMTTPRGGQYQIILADGTLVYLNAASSLRYPVSFNGKTRNVILKGEAYFDVAKDKKHPFIVTAGGQNITVLGTHFNVNAYEDEPYSKTTLLEGSVRVSTTSEPSLYKSEVILVPGQQSILEARGLKVSEADLSTELAWKNGYFKFKRESLESIMRKISRWYNVDVAYTSDAPKRVTLGGFISRSKNISAILESMEQTEKVSFKIEGRKITVLKYK